jgi:ATP-dependent DNA helicase RecG
MPGCKWVTFQEPTARRQVEAWSAPPEVVREAVFNEVAHADWTQRGSPLRVAIYEDLIEAITLRASMTIMPAVAVEYRNES